MANAWMPGTDRLVGETSAAPPRVGAPRAVWTVTGSGPGVWSAREEARRLVDEGQAVHLVWNPLTGEVVQSLAATRRSQMPLGRTNLYEQHLDHGDEGRVCVAVAVVARLEDPFTNGPMHGLSPILEWLDSWGVARRWPAGPPGRGRPSAEEAGRAWARGGHFGHDQVPGSSSAGPGRLDTARLLVAAPPEAHGGRSPSAFQAPAPAPHHADQQPSVIM